MEEKSLESTLNRPQGDRIVDATMVTIDLDSFKKQIKR